MAWQESTTVTRKVVKEYSTEESGGMVGGHTETRRVVSSAYADPFYGMSESEKTEKIRLYLEGFRYTPITAPKSAIIQRSVTSLGSGQGQVVAKLSMSTASGAGSAGESVVDSEQLQKVVRGVTEDEKDRARQRGSIVECNDKLVNYIQRTRDLERQNRELTEELLALRRGWGQSTAEYRRSANDKLDDLRKRLEASENVKGDMEVRITGREGEIFDIRERVDEQVRLRTLYRERAEKQRQRLLDLEAELKLLKSRKTALDMEKQKLRKANDDLRKAISDDKVKLDKESSDHIHEENKAYCRQEELEFLRLVWALEKKELERLSSNEASAESREYWKIEIAQLFRDLHDIYDGELNKYRSYLVGVFNFEGMGAAQKSTGQLDQLRAEVNKYREENELLKRQLDELEPKVALWEKKVADLQTLIERKRVEYDTEYAALMAELSGMKREIERLMAELRRLFDQKVMLELEITQYRKLLELEENRTGVFIMKKVEKVVEKVQEEEERSGRMEYTARTVAEKHAKGDLEITEMAPDGKFCTVANTKGTSNTSLHGYKLVRNVDYGRVQFEFKFPDGFSIAPGEKIRVWSKGARPAGNTRDLEHEKVSWAVGAFTNTDLINEEGEVVANFATKTVFG